MFLNNLICLHTAEGTPTRQRNEVSPNDNGGFSPSSAIHSNLEGVHTEMEDAVGLQDFETASLHPPVEDPPQTRTRLPVQRRRVRRQPSAIDSYYGGYIESTILSLLACAQKKLTSNESNRALRMLHGSAGLKPVSIIIAFRTHISTIASLGIMLEVFGKKQAERSLMTVCVCFSKQATQFGVDNPLEIGVSCSCWCDAKTSTCDHVQQFRDSGTVTSSITHVLEFMISLPVIPAATLPPEMSWKSLHPVSRAARRFKYWICWLRTRDSISTPSFIPVAEYLVTKRKSALSYSHTVPAMPQRSF